MAIAGGQNSHSRWAALRDVFAGPQLAAFLPAVMLGAYWFGGEGVLLTTAVIFPAILAFLTLFSGARGRPPRRDPVTGLPGPEKLTRAIDDSLAGTSGADSDARIAVVVEIDNFAALEDQYGEAGSESVQRQAADRLIGVLRERDIVAGLGPGRFGLALAKTPRVDLETMIQLSGRLQEALADPISLDAARVLLTASVGFALPSRVPDQTGEAMEYALVSAFFLMPRGSSADVLLAERCDIPEAEWMQRDAFGLFLSAFPQLRFASVRSDAIYVVPGGLDLAFSLRELQGDGYDYLLPIE